MQTRTVVAQRVIHQREWTGGSWGIHYNLTALCGKTLKTATDLRSDETEADFTRCADCSQALVDGMVRRYAESTGPAEGYDASQDRYDTSDRYSRALIRKGQA